MVGSGTRDVKRGLRSGEGAAKIFGAARLTHSCPFVRLVWPNGVPGFFMPRPKPSVETASAATFETSRPVRAEWLALLVIVLLATGLRLAFPSSMAIEHFDEGVYASNIFFSAADGGQYPYRHLYAPPLLPWLIEWAIVFGGTRSLAPFVPSLVLGIATVPLAWWTGRRWFGPAAGICAAFLLAMSDLHIIYSRAALTDVPVMFWMLLAVYLYSEAVCQRNLRWAALAGLATGLAWWTKYTGWLPLAIAGSGTVPWLLGIGFASNQPFRERLRAFLGCWGVMAGVAFLIWLPVLWGLRDQGGYAAVAENHRGYLANSPSQYLANARILNAKLNWLSEWTTDLSLAVVVGWMFFRQRANPWMRWGGTYLGAVLFLLLAAKWGPVLTFGLLGALRGGMELFWRLRESISERTPTRMAALPFWLVVAWFAGMTLATPLYTPYPRMIFPWFFAAIFLVCLWHADREKTRVPETGWSPWVLPIALAAILPLAIYLPRRPLTVRYPLYEFAVNGFAQRGMLWEDRTGRQEFARACLARLKEAHSSHQPVLVYVLGDPALFYQLASAGPENFAVLPTGDSDVLKQPVAGVPTYVVCKAVDVIDFFPSGQSDRRSITSDASRSIDLPAPPFEMVLSRTFSASSQVWLDSPFQSPRDIDNVSLRSPLVIESMVLVRLNP